MVKRSLGEVPSEPEPDRRIPSPSPQFLPEPQQLRAGAQPEDFVEVDDSPPRGLTLRHVLRGHKGCINQIAWSPDGQFLISPSDDTTACIWNAETGEPLAILRGSYEVKSVRLSPDGRMLAWAADDGRISLWNVQLSKIITISDYFKEHVSATTLAWSHDGQVIAAGFSDGKIRLWDVHTAQYLKTLEGHKSTVTYLAWSPDRQILASSSYDRTIRLWSPKEEKALFVLVGHSDHVYCVDWAPDGITLASSSKDQTIRLWDSRNGDQDNILEGHTGPVTSVSFSADGRLLASKSADGTVLLWRMGTWQEVVVIPVAHSAHLTGSLAFHPTKPVLAAVGEGDNVVKIWDVDTQALMYGESASSRVKYTTAKLVLVGDSGVGKTGLGWRLAHGEFKEHASTHGQQFWVVNELSTKLKDGTLCEAVLWDLAGQAIYGTVHAIFLENVDLAMVLFDPTDRQDSLKDAQFWVEQLSGNHQLPRTILVGARVDRGSPVLSQQELDQFCQRYGISGGYISTSAMTGVGLDKLRDILKSQIPWEQMTSTVTTITFKRIKEYVLTLKEKPDRRGTLMRPVELRQQLLALDLEWQFTDAEMMTAVKHLETHGYVTLLHSSSGEVFILLLPDLLANLASSIVLQADRHPRELGALSETVLLQGGYPFQELSDLEQAEQQVLLDAAVERFLAHNICFRETLGVDTLLIFPSLIKQKRPLFDEVEVVEDISYSVWGRVENVYAALVVLLGYTPTFTRINQWQNQVQYEMNEEVCGFRVIEERAGKIELVLFYSPAIPDYGRKKFQGLFEEFLFQRDVQVTRFPPVVCSQGHRQERATVVKRLRERKSFLFCEECGNKIHLPESEKPHALGAKDVRLIQREEALARVRSAYETQLVRVKGFRRDRAFPRCYISHAPEQAYWVSRLAHDLRDAGVIILEDRAQVQESDFVILVGTPAYMEARDRSAQPIASDINLIGAHLSQADSQWPTVIPLLQEGDLNTALLKELRDRLVGDFRDKTRYAVSLFDVVLTLYAIQLDHPAFKPLRETLQKQWEEMLSGRREELQPLKIFISYSHKDEQFKEELITMLDGLERRKIIEPWQDQHIEVGDEWYRTIQVAMNESDLALLLVSPDFLASRFIRDEELPRLLQRRKEQGLHVMPVIVRPCIWKSEPVLGDLQALPKNGTPVISFPKATGERDQIWTDIATAIETHARRRAKESSKDS